MKVKELSKIVVLIGMGVLLTGQSPVPTDLPSGYPNWWFERDVIQRLDPIGDLSPIWSGSYPAQEERAAFNIGQLKQVAAAARDEMEMRLSGGAGAEINSLINSWTVVSPEDTNAVVIGQLKYVASLFLQRLDTVGYTDPLSGVTGNESPSEILASWSLSDASDNDKNLAVIGQLKYLFSWDLSNFSSSTESDNDGTGDDWELANFGGLDQDGAVDLGSYGILDINSLLYSAATMNANSSWLGSPHTLPGVIEAEDYDVGANGVAYLDSTTGNTGSEYRNDDVDIEITADTGGGYNVAWATGGEYLNYTVDVTQAGLYNITARVASDLTNSRKFHIEVNGVNLGNMSLRRNNSNKGWQNWTNVTLENVQLNAGEQEMRFVFDNGKLNLNKLTFSLAFVDSDGDGMDDAWELANFGALNQDETTDFDKDGILDIDEFINGSDPVNTTSPWLGSPHNIPGVIEAEDYDVGASGVAYLDSTAGNNGNQYRNDDVDVELTSDTGGGYNIGWVTAGEYLSYTVNVTQAGAYNIMARVATGITTARNFHIEVDGVNLGNMSLLRNNSNKGWQSWTDVILENVHLSAGEHEMRFVFDNGKLNLNKLTFMHHGGHGGHGHHTGATSVSDNINDFATHMAMQNGDWDDPNTWMMGNIPGPGAIVHIHHGVSVTYRSNDPDTHIFYIHVDGNLNITSDNGVTRLQVDTIVTTPGSELNIDGSSGNLLDIVINPYDSNRVDGLSDGAYTANGETVDDGFGVLGRYQWDPQQMSLGIITEGKVDIKGKEKIGHLEMSETGQDGDDSISIDISEYNLGNNANLTDIQNEIGWSLGDIIVVGGTEYYRTDDQKTYDELTKISSLDVLGGKLVVGLEDRLKYDHEVTELDTDSDGSFETRLSPTVINLYKNVQIRSEVSTNTSGNGYVESVNMGVITQNGHTMFMHTTDVSIQDVNFAGLGRTDKSTPIDDLDTQGNTEDHIDITNHRGRYSVHLHLNGFMESGDKNLDDNIDYGGAYLSGNLVWGSPGWGMTHHAGLATLTDNVTYDIFGAGFVSETGDETGAWDNNVAMKMIGNSTPTDERSSVENQDFGNTGVGFWFESRMIEVTNNKSISSDSAPFFIDGSGGQSATISIEDLPDFLLPYADALDRSGGLDGMVAARDIPVFRFDNNMATATHTGIWVEEGAGMAGRDIGALEHDIRSVYTNHRSYNIERSGFFVVNTSQVTAIDTIVSGTYPEDGVGSGIIGHAGQAFAGGAYQQAYEVALNGIYLDNFGAGAQSFNKAYFSTDPIQHQGSSVKDHTFVNISISDRTIDRLDRPTSHDTTHGETSDLFSPIYYGNRDTTKFRAAPDFSDNDGNNVVEGRFTVILGSQSDTLAYSATRNNDFLLEKIKVTNENYIFDSDEVNTGNVDPGSYVTGIWGVKIDSAGATYAPFIDHDQDGQDFDNIGEELSMALTVSDLEYLVNKNGIVAMNGERFVIMEEYFSDRLTGKVQTIHYTIRLNGDYWNQFGTSVEIDSLTFGYAKDNVGNASITINNITYSENETLQGANKDDLIFAQFGDDVVNGKGGDDVLYGGFGNDKLNGNNGNDVLIGGGGSDILNGGSGTDTAVLQGSIDDYTITQTGSNAYSISSNLWLDGENTLKNIEYIQFNGDALLTDPSNSLNLSSYFGN